MKIYLCEKCDFVTADVKSVCPNCKNNNSFYKFKSDLYYDLSEKQENTLIDIIFKSDEFEIKGNNWIKENSLISLLLVNAIDNGYTFLFANDDEYSIFIDSKKDTLCVPGSNKTYSKTNVLNLFGDKLQQILNKNFVVPIMEFCGIEFMFLDVIYLDYCDIHLEIIDDMVADKLYEAIDENPHILTDELDKLFI